MVDEKLEPGRGLNSTDDSREEIEKYESDFDNNRSSCGIGASWIF